MGQLVDGPLTWPLYARKIIDWIVGDDRVWEGGFPLPIFPATETSVSDMYLTIKIDPTQVDAMALLQAHVTTTYSPTGIIQINAGIVSATLRAFGSIIFNAIGNGVGSLGPYQYDISAISAPNGYIWKAETGMIVFQQNVTQTNVAGTPAVLPNQGIPVFRGFANGPPLASAGPFNAGDYFRNATPTSGEPSGWVCVTPGTPGASRTDGIVGNT